MLLKSETSIVRAPGMQSSWYVESKSKKMPHLVRESLKGAISCDKVCEHYRSIGICSHTVAIAHKLGSLETFTQSFIKKKGRRSPNLGKFALTGMPAGQNRKGDIPPRKRLPKRASSLLPHLPLDISIQEEDSNSGPSSADVPPSSGACKQSKGKGRLSTGGSGSVSSTSGGILSCYQESPYHQLYTPPYQQASSTPSYHPYSPMCYQPNYAISRVGHPVFFRMHLRILQL